MHIERDRQLVAVSAAEQEAEHLHMQTWHKIVGPPPVLRPAHSRSHTANILWAPCRQSLWLRLCHSAGILINECQYLLNIKQKIQRSRSCKLRDTFMYRYRYIHTYIYFFCDCIGEDQSGAERGEVVESQILSLPLFALFLSIFVIASTAATITMMTHNIQAFLKSQRAAIISFNFYLNAPQAIKMST